MNNKNFITVKDFKEYLNNFSDNEAISLVVVNSEERLHYISKEVFLVKDTPAIIMDTVSHENMEG